MISPVSVGRLGLPFHRNHRAPGARLTTVTPPSGGMPGQSFGYDALDRMTSRSLGTATWTTLWSSGKGTTTGPDGVQTELLLDGRGRVAVQTWSVGSEAGLTRVEYDRDALGQPLWVKEEGAGAEETTYLYDGRSRLTSVRRGSGPAVSYEYVDSPKQARVTTPGGSVTYGYDATTDRVEQITGPAGTTTVEWEAGGELPEVIRDGNLYQRRCYDGAGRVTEVLNATEDVACGEMGERVVSGFQYGYDGRGNRTSELAFGTGGTRLTSYGYDEADRLTGVQHPGQAVVYQLAGDGTRLGEKEAPAALLLGVGGFEALAEPTSHRTYAYGLQGGLASVTEMSGTVPVPVVTYELDAVGRPTKETRGADVKTFGWDGAGRLRRVGLRPLAGAQFDVTYGYDHAGLRIWKEGPGGRSTWLWGGGVLEEETPAGGTAVRYTRLGSLAIAAGADRLLHDGLGSVVGRVGPSAPEQYRYDAWGAVRSPGVPGATGGGTLAYAGQHWDADVGLSYAQQRWYEPEVGRFLSEDPLGASAERLREPGRLQAFAYGVGNPLHFIDPQGLDAGQAEYLPREYDDTPPDAPSYDAAVAAAVLQKPGDVIQWWNSMDDWKTALPLTAWEQQYMRLAGLSEVRPQDLTTDEVVESQKLFGHSEAARGIYATRRSRRQIVTHYALRHPATLQYLLGTYRLGRDSNPLHFAFERGWQVGGGKETFTNEKVSRVGAAEEFALALVLMKGVNTALSHARPPAPGPFFHDPGTTSGRASSRLVAYGSDELSQEAVRYRMVNKMWGGRNVAVFEYEVNGETKRLAISSRGPTAVDLEPELKAGFGHAERRGLRVLQRMGVGDQVKRVYTELEPCMARGGYCARMLSTDLPNVPVTYSFPYATPSDGVAVDALKAAAGAYQR